jgi:predicted dehydrogenase
MTRGNWKVGKLRIGVVGTGFIASKIASSIGRCGRAEVAVVSSRSIERANAFVAEHPGAVAVESADALVHRADVEAVFVATPTTAKEEIALRAINEGKHVLVDKPYVDASSVQRIADAAAAKDLVFMDGTHFVHHPRTAAVRASLRDRIGSAKSLHTAFYFPFSDRDNIRFDSAQEPTGALGDMAWYSMRAIVEYLRPKGGPISVAAMAERDRDTRAIIRVSGFLTFQAGETSTFDVGYTAGTVIMDLSLLGTDGMITMDDFVLDWANSIGFQNPTTMVGFVHRRGMATREDFAFVETPSKAAQDVLMIESFAQLVASGRTGSREAHVEATLATQQYLDAIRTEMRTS